MLEPYSISTDKSKLDVAYIYNYLSTQSYWAKERSLDVVKRSIDGSFCFGVYCNDKQVGFARVVTDTAVFAYIADVFIDEAYRGKGLSKQLMKVILAYPEFKTITQWSLKTLDAHGLYRQFGFNEPVEPKRILELRLKR